MHYDATLDMPLADLSGRSKKKAECLGGGGGGSTVGVTSLPMQVTYYRKIQHTVTELGMFIFATL